MESDGCKLARGQGAHGSGGGHAKQGSGMESHEDRPPSWGRRQGEGSIRRPAEAPVRSTGSSPFLTDTSSKTTRPHPAKDSDAFSVHIWLFCTIGLQGLPVLSAVALALGRQACVEIASLASNEGWAGAWEKAEDRGQLCNLIIRLQKGDLIYSCSSLLS